MEIVRYSELKEKGLISLVKIGNAWAYSLKKFDSMTGEEVEPEVGAIDIKQLREQKNNLQNQIDVINIILNDLKALG